VPITPFISADSETIKPASGKGFMAMIFAPPLLPFPGTHHAGGISAGIMTDDHDQTVS